MSKAVQNISQFFSHRLEKVFHQVFFTGYNTCLIGGGLEPVYRPAIAGQPAQVIYRHDYFASALHEVAHWCVAGKSRRLQEDYGYWYAPDGRTEEQQALFEQVEIKPQAMEWIFAQACGYKFRVSADNLIAGAGASAEFKQNIFTQVQIYCNRLPERAHRFTLALMEEFDTCSALNSEMYCLSMLD